MNKPKIILGIETSCDETSAAVVKMSSYGKPSEDERVHILSNVVASSAQLQAKYGGVIPEQAAREQLKSIIPVIESAIHDSRLTISDLDAIAVTEGPGLIGSLLVGVETAKVLATIWQKPLIPVNHLLGHFYANWINNTPSFPCLGLLVSGGHTDLVLFTDHGKYKYLGGTRDDAAGECFDKCARLLNLPYPGGPNLSKLAEKGNPKIYKLPRPMMDSGDLDFSFSGLKTAVLNLIKEGVARAGALPRGGPARQWRGVGTRGAGERQDPKQKIPDELSIPDLAASIEDAITDVLVEKALRAAKTYQVDQIIVAGGVAANQTLANKFRRTMAERGTRLELFIPPVSLCTDNAAYIATAAFFNYHPVDPLKLQANPNLSLVID